VEERRKEGWENSERCRSLYLEKAAGGATPAALPEEAAPNLTGSRLGWKQKRTALSPRRRLLIKSIILNFFNSLSFYLFKLFSFYYIPPFLLFYLYPRSLILNIIYTRNTIYI